MLVSPIINGLVSKICAPIKPGTQTGVFSVNGTGERMRLNCTAYTDDVDFEVVPS